MIDLSFSGKFKAVLGPEQNSFPLPITILPMGPHTCTQITMCKNTFFVHRLPCGKKALFYLFI